MLIGLCGYARSGKDSAADGLEGFTRYSFADPLKTAFDGTVQHLLADANMPGAIHDLFMADCSKEFFVKCAAANINDALDYVGGVKAEHKAKLRPGYVALGAGMRAIMPDFWIRHLDARMKAWMTPAKAVITDVRYLNEVKYVIENKGIVIYIKRPGLRPANAEERKSFKAIREAVKNKEVSIITVKNDSDILTLQERVKAAIANK